MSLAQDRFATVRPMLGASLYVRINGVIWSSISSLTPLHRFIQLPQYPSYVMPIEPERKNPPSCAPTAKLIVIVQCRCQSLTQRLVVDRADPTSAGSLHLLRQIDVRAQQNRDTTSERCHRAQTKMLLVRSQGEKRCVPKRVFSPSAIKPAG